MFLTPQSVESQTAVTMFFKLTFFFILKSIVPLLCLDVVFQTVDLVSLGSSRGAFLANFAEIGKSIQGAPKVRFPLDGIRCRACWIVFSRINSPLTKYFNIVSIPVFVRSVNPGYFEQSSVSINPLHPQDFASVQPLNQPFFKAQSLFSRKFTVIVHDVSSNFALKLYPASQLKNQVF